MALADNKTKIQALLDGINALPDAGSGGDNVFEQISGFTYAVEAINGAQYGFTQNSNGYWESENKGVNNSYAACRVQFEVKNACDITFDVINYAEKGWDYAQFGLLDTAISLSDAVGDPVHRDFKNENSPNVVNVIYENVPAGSHFIDVKFRKDGSTSSYNDSVQFKVQPAPIVESIRADVLPRIRAAESDLIPENIKNGVDIFGVIGTFTGNSSGGVALSKAEILTWTPTKNFSGEVVLEHSLGVVPDGYFVVQTEQHAGEVNGAYPISYHYFDVALSAPDSDICMAFGGCLFGYTHDTEVLYEASSANELLTSTNITFGVNVNSDRYVYPAGMTYEILVYKR